MLPRCSMRSSRFICITFCRGRTGARAAGHELSTGNAIASGPTLAMDNSGVLSRREGIFRRGKRSCSRTRRSCEDDDHGEVSARDGRSIRSFAIRSGARDIAVIAAQAGSPRLFIKAARDQQSVAISRASSGDPPALQVGDSWLTATWTMSKGSSAGTGAFWWSAHGAEVAALQARIGWRGRQSCFSRLDVEAQALGLPTFYRFSRKAAAPVLT